MDLPFRHEQVNVCIQRGYVHSRKDQAGQRCDDGEDEEEVRAGQTKQ